MENTVILEWRYAPEDYFEEPPEIERDGCEFTIEAGRITATMDPDLFDPGGEKRSELHTAVESHFRAVQLVTHKKFELGQPGLSRIYADGRREIALSVDVCIGRGAIDDVDAVITDADGNVISDPRRERLASEKRLAEVIARLLPKDALLCKLLDCYAAAVEDPNDEFVHLYEIRDALQSLFGSASEAVAALKFSSTRWSRLGRLACNEPLQEGRHRGEHLPLRAATAAELQEARGVAFDLIEAYIEYASP